MEDKLIQKPCVVQKIETPQGFSLSYQEHLLYSKYNPTKNILSLVEKLELLPGTIILCCSPLLGYGLKELLNKIPENCLIVLCEAEKALYDFSLSENIFDLTDRRILCCPPEELNSLPLKLYTLAHSGEYKRVIRIDMSAGTQFHKDFYDDICRACQEAVMTFWKNRLTLTKFGRRYSRNLFENLHYLADTKPLISSLRANNTNRSILSDYFILCADTALQALLKNGIKADGVFIEEAQSIIVKAFTGTPKDIHIFAGLSSIPNIVHRAGPENLSYFFTEYTNALFIDELKAQNFMPPVNQPFGSVGLTAVYYALKFRKDESIPVFVVGLDFSYSSGLTHTKGAMAHILRLIHANRLLPPQNYAAAYGPGTEKTLGKNGRQVITTPALKSYAQMFQSFFANEKNLFDAGQSGIDLGLPHADIDCKAAKAPHKEATSKFEDTGHHEAKSSGNPHTKDLAEYLSKEKESLEYLRDLLTGCTELKGKELFDKIEEIAQPREYLYLHFADGYSFNTSQSFLNRIRTEIDFFLKFL